MKHLLSFIEGSSAALSSAMQLQSIFVTFKKNSTFKHILSFNHKTLLMCLNNMLGTKWQCFFYIFAFETTLWIYY